MTDPGPSVFPEERQIFPPTLREVMLRPRWLAMLGLCLLVAGVFSWLLQWQLGRAIDTDPPEDGATEIVQPLDEIAQPGEYLDESLVGQRVELSGTWVAGDFIVVAGRANAGTDGYWVTGQLRVSGADEPTSIAVAVGFTTSESDAEAAAAAFDDAAADADAVELTGRLISDEGPTLPDEEQPWEITRMSPAALLALWHDTEADGERIAVYRQFLVSDDPVSGLARTGLVAIDSPAPEAGSPINWLNLFYAVEWAVFAVFSFYLWYRLAKDAWERELEVIAGVDPDAADDED